MKESLVETLGGPLRDGRRRVGRGVSRWGGVPGRHLPFSETERISLVVVPSTLSSIVPGTRWGVETHTLVSRLHPPLPSLFPSVLRGTGSWSINDLDLDFHFNETRIVSCINLPPFSPPGGKKRGVWERRG